MGIGDAAALSSSLVATAAGTKSSIVGIQLVGGSGSVEELHLGPRPRTLELVPWDLNAGDMVGVLDDDGCGRGGGWKKRGR